MKTASKSREARIPAAAGADPLTVLCAVDGSEAAYRAADLGRRCNARLASVSVAFGSAAEQGSPALPGGGMTQGTGPAAAAKGRRSLPGIAVGVVREAGIQDVERPVVIDGSSAEAIANELGAGVIALGHHGRYAVKDLLLGRKVLDRASQSVLPVK